MKRMAFDEAPLPRVRPLLGARAFALWIAILVCAVANGVLREAVLVPWLGARLALPLSGVLLSLAVVAVAWLGAGWLGASTTSRALGVGALWLVLTLVFEFAFGRLVQQRSWRELFEAYTFDGGNLWPAVLLVVFLAPWLAVRAHRRASRAARLQ
jgi:hypothetical protein